MPDDLRLEIQVELDDGSIRRGFANIEREAGRSAREAGDSLQRGIGDGIRQGGNRSRAEGRRAGNNFSSGFRAGTVALAAAAAAVGAAVVGGLAVGRFVEAAQQQEDAVNSLNSALIGTGRFTEEFSQNIQDFASEIQQNSRFGDELILENAALIQSLGDLDEQGLSAATQAAADLASGLGVDLATASQLVGRAASGNVSVFSRYGLAIEAGANASETFSNALEAINERFSGAAARDVQTFSGAVQQLENSFGDTLEGFGAFITESQSLTALINGVSGAFATLSGQLNNTAENNDIFRPFVLAALDLAETINTVLTPSVQALGSVFSSLFEFVSDGARGLALIGQQVTNFFGGLEGADALRAELNSVTISIGQLAEERDSLGTGLIDSILPDSIVESARANLDSQIQELSSRREQIQTELGALVNVSDQETDIVADAIRRVRDRLNSESQQTITPDQATGAPTEGNGLSDQQSQAILNQVNQLSDALDMQLLSAEENLEESLFRQEEIIRQALENRIISQEEGQILLSQIEQSGAQQRIAIREQVAAQDMSFNATFLNGLRQLGQQATSIISGGIGNAFQALGSALASGEDASRAFSEVFRSMIADLASAAGDFFIGQGLGLLLGGDFVRGPGLIAAGAALKLLAGTLGGSTQSNATPVNNVGSTGGGIASSSGDGLTASDNNSDIIGLDEVERERVVPQVNLTIQGDIFDSEETGTRIAGLISEAFENEDINLVNGRLA